ncbi:MAG: hypothetical protein KKA67_16575 [Spirochaetes bacterium]|nr:hypothetical protein [Spirochaetota bacterium]MBU1081139.1 hypothetical protein [Spirochaetota bacterium]
MERTPRSAPQAKALLLIAGAGHGFSLAYAYLMPRAAEVPSGPAYSIILIAFSALLLAPLARWARDPGVGFLVLGAKAGIAVLVLTPLWFPSPLKVLVVCVLVIEIAFVLPRPWDVAGAAIAIALALSTQAGRKLWDIVAEPASVDELAFLALLPALAGLLAGGYKDALLGYDRSAAEAARLRDGSQAIILANVRFQEQAQELEDASSARERKRISREIHDIVGYAVTNQAMAMEAALVLLEKDDRKESLRALLENARDQSRDGLAEVRAALYEIRKRRPPYVDFQNRMIHICRTFNRATGVEVACEVVGQHVRIPVGLDMALYRIVQAGLTNSFLHGKARNVRVLIQGVEGTLHLSIQDDGVGAAEVHEGIGLAGMRERLSPFGGTLAYKGDEGGFLVKATVPLDEKDARA